MIMIICNIVQALLSILDFRVFDLIIILVRGDGHLIPIWDFPESVASNLGRDNLREIGRRHRQTHNHDTNNNTNNTNNTCSHY